MLLRGTTVDMKACLFQLEDIPVKVNQEFVALLARKGSSLIIADSIVRGCEDGGYFEGDMVLDKEFSFVGTVVYNKGFMLYDIKDKVLKPMPDLNTVNIEEDLRVNLNLAKECKQYRTNVTWVFDDTRVDISNIVTGKNGKIVVTNYKSRYLSIKKFRLFTGIVIDDNMICFGDTINGGTVVLHNGVPMIKSIVGDNYVELVKE